MNVGGREMAQEFMLPAPAFTLELLVASRRWSDAQQASGRKKVNPAKTGGKAVTIAVPAKTIKPNE